MAGASGKDNIKRGMQRRGGLRGREGGFREEGGLPRWATLG